MTFNIGRNYVSAGNIDINVFDKLYLLFYSINCSQDKFTKTFRDEGYTRKSNQNEDYYERYTIAEDVIDSSFFYKSFD